MKEISNPSKAKAEKEAREIKTQLEILKAASGKSPNGMPASIDAAQRIRIVPPKKK